MDLNKNKVSYNFLKSMEIIHINNETVLLHPSAHEFWEEDEIRNNLMEFLVGWSKNQLYTEKLIKKLSIKLKLQQL